MTRTLAIILATALAVRVAVFLIVAGHADRIVSPDTGTYVLFARAWPTDLWSPSAGDLGTTLLRTPGYPALIALAGLSLSVVLWIQIGLSLFTIWLVFRITMPIAGSLGATIAAAIVAFEPVTLSHDFLVLSEILFMASLMLATALWLHGMQPDLRFMAAAGLVFGLANLVRPVALYLIVPLLVFTAIKLWRHHPLVPCTVLLIAFLIPTGAWIGRNMALTGHPVYSTIEGYNMAFYRGSYAIAFQDHISVDQADAMIGSHISAINPVILADQEEQVGVQALLTHPIGAAKLFAYGAAAMLIGSGYTEWQKLLGLTSSNRVIEALGFALNGGLLALSLVGSWLAVRAKRWELLAMMVISAYLIIVSSGGETNSRMRVAIEPYIAILAAYAVVEMRARFLRRNNAPSGRGA